ncbi:MAG: hypothetical protein IIA67_14060, partial [Planctomycetes bacterium]|nr:hypothetical protein [Planctomycetota bacterium]
MNSPISKAQLIITFALLNGMLAAADAKQWQPKLRSDLLAISRKAADGATIALGNGKYQGPVEVTGKKL